MQESLYSCATTLLLSNFPLQIKAAAIARTYQNNLGPCSEGELIKLISRGKLDNNRVVDHL